MQAELAARLATIEQREASLSAREGFCGRLETELAARGALLEAQTSAAAAQAAGAPPPAEASAQAARAVQLLQALAADGGLPTEIRHREVQQQLQQHTADTAQRWQQQRQGQQQEHGMSGKGHAAPAGNPRGGHAAGARADSFAADSGALQALSRELQAAGVIGGGSGGSCAAATGQPHGIGGQPAFSQHSHHSTMSHATAVDNPNDRWAVLPYRRLTSSCNRLKLPSRSLNSAREGSAGLISDSLSESPRWIDTPVDVQAQHS